MLSYKNFTLLEDRFDNWFKEYPPYVTKIISSNQRRLLYRFRTHNGRLYDLLFMFPYSYDTSHLYNSPGEVAWVSFSLGSGYKQNETDDRIEAIRVFTTVSNEMIKLVARGHETSIGKREIYAMGFIVDQEEKSRVRMYNTFLPILAQKLNMSYLQKGDLSIMFKGDIEKFKNSMAYSKLGLR